MIDIGKEYGTALFMLACEENAKAEYAENVEMLRGFFTEEPDYLEFLSSPGIPMGERLEAIKSAFSESVPEHFLSFLMLLCEKGRIGCFFAAADEFKALFDASQHVISARITSAVELTDEQKLQLTKKLESISHGTVESEYFIDASTLGGIIVEMDGKILDGSLRHSLRELKEVMNT